MQTIIFYDRKNPKYNTESTQLCPIAEPLLPVDFHPLLGVEDLLAPRDEHHALQQRWALEAFFQ